MRIATWNVNSIRSKTGLITDVLTKQEIDVLAIQETKCTQEQFPVELFSSLGYDVAVVGKNQWNGVAIASRVGLSDVRELPNQPGFSKDLTADPADPDLIEPRAVIATCGTRRDCDPQSEDTTVDIGCFYIPNGRSINDPHFTYKLDFLRAVSDFAATSIDDDPDKLMVLMGDWNIAPEDDDVWDIKEFTSHTHVTPRERAALGALDAEGFVDVTRAVGYTYWDFQKVRFRRNEGMRIDMQWASPALAPLASHAFVDRATRAVRGTSDHAPVIVDYDIKTAAPEA